LADEEWQPKEQRIHGVLDTEETESVKQHTWKTKSFTKRDALFLFLFLLDGLRIFNPIVALKIVEL
jgi:hypothetical protein